MKIDKEILLEQYKLFVGTSESNSNRRASANRYFLSVNTFLLGLSGYLTSLDPRIWHLLTSLLGMTLCIYWLLTLKSYRGLNTAKFKVIHKLEQHLPVRLFGDEWDYLDKGKNPKKYLKLSVLEQGVPILFAILYTLIFIIKLLEFF